MIGNQLKYKSIEKQIEQLIAAATPGDRIPSDRDLAEQFQCNIQTLRKAFNPFIERGVIIRRAGSGTFVADTTESRVPADLQRLGMLIHADSDSYAFSVIRAIHNASLRHNISIRVAIARGYAQEGERMLKTLLDEGCSAIIIPWCPFHEVSSLASFVRNALVPVTTPELIPGLEKYYFEPAELAGLGGCVTTRTACEYFHLLGEKRIALLGPGSPDNVSMKNKLCAYSEYVYKNKLENLVAMTTLSADDMEELVQQWRNYCGELAVICYDDVYALRFIMTMHKHGLYAPRDFRIIGDNDTGEALLCDPLLSSFRANYDNLAECQIHTAMALARGETAGAAKPAANQLIIRQSCGGAGRIDDRLTAAIQTFSDNLVVLIDQDKRQTGGMNGPSGEKS